MKQKSVTTRSGLSSQQSNWHKCLSVCELSPSAAAVRTKSQIEVDSSGLAKHFWPSSQSCVCVCSRYVAGCQCVWMYLSYSQTGDRLPLLLSLFFLRPSQLGVTPTWGRPGHRLRTLKRISEMASNSCCCWRSFQVDLINTHTLTHTRVVYLLSHMLYSSEEIHFHFRFNNSYIWSLKCWRHNKSGAFL